MAEPVGKQEMRERVWRAMEIHGAARFPGAEGAALQLQTLTEWKRARVVKINPDAPQLPVRRMALREGKLVYFAVPRLRAERPFLELDPARLGARGPKAATIKGAAVHGRPVGLDDMQ